VSRDRARVVARRRLLNPAICPARERKTLGRGDVIDDAAREARREATRRDATPRYAMPLRVSSGSQNNPQRKPVRSRRLEPAQLLAATFRRRRRRRWRTFDCHRRGIVRRSERSIRRSIRLESKGSRHSVADIEGRPRERTELSFGGYFSSRHS